MHNFSSWLTGLLVSPPPEVVHMLQTPTKIKPLQCGPDKDLVRLHGTM